MTKHSMKQAPIRSLTVILVITLILAALWAARLSRADEPPSSPIANSPPQMMNYQGTVNVDDSPHNGTGYFKFAITTVPNGDGTANKWANDATAVGQPSAAVPLTVSGGLFNVLLGDTTLTGMSEPIDEDVFISSDRYLRVWFSQTSGGTYAALEPNQRIASVAYAFHATYSDSVGYHTHAGQSWSTDTTYVLKVTNSHADGNALKGEATGASGNGVYAKAYGGGDGVYGIATGPGARGVYGYSNNDSGRGVYGYANGSTGIGVRAYSPNYRGVVGITGATDGIGVIGYRQPHTEPELSSPGSIGVYGGAKYGVLGVSDTDSGAAILGVDDSPTGAYAGVFRGDVKIVGELSKSSGAFQIDHPLDPQNRYLNHSFVESPDMMNIYNGSVQLDEKGETWVDLPTYFEALNFEFRYQLTPIGSPGPNLYIAEEIANNRFKIAGGKPGSKVSWQVTGIRHDPYAVANRIQVEEDKPPAEQGTYTFPELYEPLPSNSESQ